MSLKRSVPPALAARLRRGWGWVLSQRYRPRRWLPAAALQAGPGSAVRCLAVQPPALPVGAPSSPTNGDPNSAQAAQLGGLPALGCNAVGYHAVALANNALLITDFYDNLSVAAGGALLAPFSQQMRHSAVQPAAANRFLSGALQPRRRPQHLPGLSLSLLSLWAVNYYHWLFDALPRLALIRRSGLLPPDARPTLLLPEPLSPFHLASLEALGLADWPRRLVGPQGFLRCEQLLLADLPSPDCSLWIGPATGGGIEAWVVDFLRRSFLDPAFLDPAFLASGLDGAGREPAAPGDQGLDAGAAAAGIAATGITAAEVAAAGIAAAGETPAGAANARHANGAPPQDGHPLRLYLSRAGESRRGVRDEALIQPLLERYGIRRLDPGQLSLAQQVRLFSQAAWVIAPHGAALANLAFCSPGTLVVELFTSGFQPGMYASLSQRIGARYHALTTPAEAGPSAGSTAGSSLGSSVGTTAGSSLGAGDGDPSLVGDRLPLRFSPALLHALEEILRHG
ncbi:MAG: glycosyltransferase 61 family protein [Synechococcaceae cyanobacterium]